MHLNYPMIIKVTGLLTLVEGIAMFPCVMAATYYDERAAASALFVTCLICVLVGLVIMTQLKLNKIKLKLHEGFLIACLSWVYCSLIGMMPFYFGIEDFTLMECYFESVAGFTTTGCSVIDVNMMPKALLLWKSICHWLGGMGILVLIVSIFPHLGIGGRPIALAEAPGPALKKMGTSISDTGQYLYTFYILLTIAEYILLVISPLNWFDALTATLSSISTAGLIITDENAALFSSTYVRFVILGFTYLSSLSYFMFSPLLRGRWKEFFSNIELRAFSLFIGASSIFIAFVLKMTGTYSSLWQAFKDSLCQVVSIISTSGYFVCDYTKWPEITQTILFLLMFIGGCSASTTGSLKVIRVVAFFKLIQRGIFKRIHPHSIKPIMLGGKPLPANTAASITMHIFLYFGVLIMSCILLSLNNLDMETTITSALGIFSNTGLALGEIGSSGNFSTFNGFSQFIFTILMIAGRLEMYAIILLFTKSFWQPDKAHAV